MLRKYAVSIPDASRILSSRGELEKCSYKVILLLFLFLQCMRATDFTVRHKHTPNTDNKPHTLATVSDFIQSEGKSLTCISCHFVCVHSE
jgi:hypothetical protein